MQFLSFLFNHRYARTLKFLISGGSAAVVDLGLLYVFTDIFHVWYLLSAVMAFGAAFAVSFTLQKFWTFDDRALDVIRKQLVRYMLLALLGLGLNTLAMYVLVDHAGLHYLMAQIIASACIAVMNFFAYKHLIFTGAATTTP
jgi:dolichol-phosphate mannosyltransferase